MTDPGVRLDREGPVTTVTLCRPHVLNAQTPATWHRLREIGKGLPGDTRVVVVRGEGRAFSAGLDLSAVSGQGGTDGLSFVDIAAMDDAAADALIADFQAGF